MIALTVVWLVIGLAAGWRIASRRVARAASRSLQRELEQAREQMSDEVRYWQDQTERIRVQVGQLAQEKDAWAAGYKQGREDVLGIVPPLIAAHLRSTGRNRPSTTTEMDDCA